jgi:hypothetical protein
MNNETVRCPGKARIQRSISKSRRTVDTNGSEVIPVSGIAVENTGRVRLFIVPKTGYNSKVGVATGYDKDFEQFRWCCCCRPSRSRTLMVFEGEKVDSESVFLGFWLNMMEHTHKPPISFR